MEELMALYLWLLFRKTYCGHEPMSVARGILVSTAAKRTTRQAWATPTNMLRLVLKIEDERHAGCGGNIHVGATNSEPEITRT